MRNEKHLPALRQERWQFRHYWTRSLLLLVFPAFQSDWTTHFTTHSDNEPAISTLALPNAHAHNDYLHDKPLLEALSRGFTSVEADVHLVGDELYLGHWFPQMFPAKTLREVYLEPLQTILSRQNGKIYPYFDGIFYLMIDVKTDSLATWAAIRKQLLQYPVFQCNPHFQVFISGNRAVYHILNDTEQVMAVDGRLTDLGQKIDPAAMPVVSDNFRKHFKWRGKGPMPGREKQKLKMLAEEAHLQGQKLRFWATPDQPSVWETLLEAGVDFISTDDLQGVEQFFRTQKISSVAY